MATEHTIRFQITGDSKQAVRQTQRMAFFAARASGLSAIESLRKVFDRPKMGDQTKAPDTRTEERRETECKAWYRLDCPPINDPLTDVAVKSLADEIEGAL